jgi:hypothetical protein
MLEAGEKQALLAAARRAIQEGLAGKRWTPRLNGLAPGLREPGAAFVTLKLDGRLRGCIGSLAPHQPLILDVAHNACAAAFEDPRFEPVDAGQAARLEIHVSVLGPTAPLPVSDEADLLAKLRPGVDGLVLHAGRQRATFLPSVWEELADPAEFLRHLKLKAGLPPGAWSDDWRFERYEVEEFGPH